MSDTAQIEHALDVLLRAVIEHEANKPPPSVEQLTATPFNWFDRNEPIPTREQCQLAGILRDPVRGALDLAIRRLGERLFEITQSTGGMRLVADRVADLDPACYGYPAIVIDHRWDGIGSGDDVWRA